MDKKIMFSYVVSALAIIIAVLGFSVKNVEKKAESDYIEFKVDGKYLQWRNDASGDWQNLYDLTKLAGADGKDGIDGINGVNGKDGREVEFTVINKVLYWRYIGDSQWIKLFSLDEYLGGGSNDEDEPAVPEISPLITSVNGSTTDFGCIANKTICLIFSLQSILLYKTEK